MRLNAHDRISPVPRLMRPPLAGAPLPAVQADGAGHQKDAPPLGNVGSRPLLRPPGKPAYTPAKPRRKKA
jgi:hypothetical protein